MKVSIAAAGLAAAALCLLVTACSGGGSVSPPAAGTEAAGTEAAGTEAAGTEAAGTEAAGTEAQGTSDGGIAAGASSAMHAGGGTTCKQLTFAQVQPLIIETVFSVTSTAITAGGQGQQCEFDAKNSDSTAAITVQVLGGSAAATVYAEAVAGETKPVAVPGVGDKASRDTEDGEVNALRGDLFCSVSYSSSDDIPGVGPLEEAHGATNNIGENYYDTIAQAMGTLCNRIYGSGNTTPDLSSLLAADAAATPSDDGGLPGTVALPSSAATG